MNKWTEFLEITGLDYLQDDLPSKVGNYPDHFLFISQPLRDIVYIAESILVKHSVDGIYAFYLVHKMLTEPSYVFGKSIPNSIKNIEPKQLYQLKWYIYHYLIEYILSWIEFDSHFYDKSIRVEEAQINMHWIESPLIINDDELELYLSKNALFSASSRPVS